MFPRNNSGPQPPMEPGQAGPVAAAAAAAAEASILSEPQVQRHLQQQQVFSQPAPWAAMPGDTLKKPQPLASYTVVRDSCSVCCEEKGTMFLFSCKHYPFCDECLRQLAEPPEGSIFCPVCKVQVTEARQIFYLNKI